MHEIEILLVLLVLSTRHIAVTPGRVGRMALAVTRIGWISDKIHL